jgi:hypothetical protein
MKLTLHICLQSEPSLSSHSYRNVLYVWAVQNKSVWCSVFICNCNTRYYVMNVMKYVRLLVICIVGGGVQIGSTRHVGHLLAYCTCPG